MTGALAVVTGASAGIGLATAGRMADAGWSVISVSRRPCPDSRVASEPCDFTDPSAVEAVAARLAERAGAASRCALVHNASLLRADRIGDLDGAALREVLEISVVAPSTLNRSIVPRLGSGSAIIYVGSTLSEKAVPGSFSYVTSKHAVVGMMRATCQDLAGSGVHTACICPGFTDTEMLRSHIGIEGEAREAVAAMSAFGRLIEPEEIAEAIEWAATHPVVNGAVIHANLGQIES